jgi:ParB family chromosome partitioning protein
MTTRHQQHDQKPAQKSSKAPGAATATAPQAPTQVIALNQLRLSALNVRKTGGQAIDDLAASIAADGLIHNLTVIRCGGKKGMHEVIAGGRRLKALQQLAKQKTIKADHAVACRIVDAEQATGMSLAENILREAMHPADQFDAFKQLVDAGKSQVEIAARFGVSAAVVRDRLTLARVAPEVIALYRANSITLDHVMAFTVTTDHDQQRALLDGQRLPSAWDIKRQLLTGAVSSKDARAVFVGKKAYEAAGGTVRKDLFASQHDASSYYEDAGLLERLAVAKLETLAEPLREAWAWVEVRAELDYSERSKYGSVPLVAVTPTDEQAEQIATLKAASVAATHALHAYEEAHKDDEDDEDAWQALADADEAARDAWDTAQAVLQVPDPTAADCAGAIVALSHNGDVQVLTGLVRPEDKARIASHAKKQAAERGAVDATDTGPSDPMPLRVGLSALRTAVVQEALAENIDAALRMLAFGLVQSTLRSFGAELYGLNVRGADKAMTEACEGLEAMPVGQRSAERAAAWAADLPTDDAALWAWCLAADDHTIRSLLAYCTARTLDGVQRFPTSRDAIGPVAQALHIDMADHWQPTAAYFAKVKKADTLAAITAAAGGQAAPELAKLKREQLAEEAAKRLAGTRWLPPTLRVAA